MRKYFIWVLLVISCYCNFSCQPQSSEKTIAKNFNWRALPDLPQAVGGPIAGVSNGAMVVAGGAYFDRSMFEGGTKIWHQEIYVMEDEEGGWLSKAKLPTPLAYSATVDTKDGIVCIGGHGPDGVSADVFMMRWNPDLKEVEIDGLPPLPHPLTFASAAGVGDVIYVAGGQDKLDATKAFNSLLALDLSMDEASREWISLEPWPGPARVLPVVTAQSDGESVGVYVVSGAEIIEVPEGEVPRRCLTDGYRYDIPKKGSKGSWKTISPIDRPVVAAPSEAFGPSNILVFSGTDCALDDQFWELKDDNPGIPADIRSYHTITDRWTTIGSMPGGKGVVTSKALHWKGGIVIVSGEDRPAHRTPNVWISELESEFPVFGAINFAVIAGYFLLLVLMGFYLSGKEKTTSDFFLAGKRIPWWAAGLSIFGTQLSALTFMALPAKVYATDWTYYLGQVGIVMMTPVVIYFFMPLFRSLNITTAYEYLELRFNLLIRSIASFNFVFLQIGRMAIVLYLPAVALSTVTGIDVYLSILTMGILSTLYTVLGGIEAVIWTDVVQVVVLLGGTFISLFLIVTQLDGSFVQLAQSAWDQGKFDMLDWHGDYTSTAVWVVVFGTTVTTLVGYTSDQTVIQRYLTTSSVKDAARALWLNAIITPISGIMFFGLGTALFLFYQSHPTLLRPELQTDAVLPLFIVQQLPVGISGLVIAALFAAAMSSLDSSMNSISATVVTDLKDRLKFLNDEESRMSLARWVTIISGIIGTGSAVLLATFQIKSVWDMIFILTGLLTGGLGGIFILGIFTTRANSIGVLVGLICSAIVMVVVTNYTNIHFFLFTAIGVFVCVLIGYLFSLILPGTKEIDLDGLTVYSAYAENEQKTNDERK